MGELVRGGAPGAVWDSATDLKSGRLFDFTVGLKTNTLPPTAQFFKMFFFLSSAAGPQGCFFAVDIKSENAVSWSTCSLSLNDSGKAPRSLKITTGEQCVICEEMSGGRVDPSQWSFCLSTGFQTSNVKRFKWT